MKGLYLNPSRGAMKSNWIFVTLVAALIMLSCKTTVLVPVRLYYTSYPVANNTKADTAILQMLSPYRDSINKALNKVIGFATATLMKKQPESPLGNFLADAIKHQAELTFGRKVDAAFINPGGIRSFIPKGEITIGKMYELMPFDNLIVLQEVSGQVLKRFLDHTAASGGWPVNGITMLLRNRKAENVLVGGKPIEDSATYIIANSDYVAGGGDDTEMLRGIPQVSKGYLMRDAFIDYIKQHTAQGKAITASIQNRVSYGN